ncbi:MAG: hypothetical protein Q7T93_02425 [Methylobacterium sp.]|uniref:DUF6894 family protein n=1 Tax=Methylobacterium sp. TaxID=409 RepID=UPI002728D647|nr:hypothetical protein [Methylobacterium sp.]MDO9425664.1 hypothetical protein [Methylobacterium sp.]
MTQYYFDVKNGVTKRDHRGLALKSDLEAIAQGKRIADEIAAEAGQHSRRVCIVREDGHEVMQVAVPVATEAPSASRLKKFS